MGRSYIVDEKAVQPVDFIVDTSGKIVEKGNMVKQHIEAKVATLEEKSTKKAAAKSKKE